MVLMTQLAGSCGRLAPASGRGVPVMSVRSGNGEAQRAQQWKLRVPAVVVTTDPIAESLAAAGLLSDRHDRLSAHERSP